MISPKRMTQTSNLFVFLILSVVRIDGIDQLINKVMACGRVVRVACLNSTDCTVSVNPHNTLTTSFMRFIICTPAY